MTAAGTGQRRPSESEASSGRPDTPALRARLDGRVRIRREAFGAVAYLPNRDRFVALDAAHAAVLRGKSGTLRPVRSEDRNAVIALAELGILRTNPAIRERRLQGRSLVGTFADDPVCAAPLVVNCFATAHCTLRCVYCHADDLMVNYRDAEDVRWLSEVLRVARATPAMVAVVTGGEPLSRPERAERLIRELGRDKAVVLDTSGVGDLHRMLPLLERYGVHLRVSMDSADRATNDALRPINRRYLPPGISSHVHAVDAIRKAVRSNIGCSVQTVVTTRNGDLPGLARLRDVLVDLGVTTWVLHVVVPAGKAGLASRTNLLSGPATVGTLDELVRISAAQDVPLDIRVTGTHRAPNAVLLISAKGELCVEDAAGGGKIMLPLPRLFARRRVLHHFRTRFDLKGHASRYLNGTLEPPSSTN